MRVKVAGCKMRDVKRMRQSLLICVVAVLVALGCGKPAGKAGSAQLSGELQVEHRFVEAGGVKWHYVEAGKGEPVVFLHGLPESWFSWHYQIEEVSKKYRVIAVDLKGYGQSDKRDGDYSLPTVSMELIALFDAIGLEKFSLVTHDWGSIIGDYVASTVPDRIIKYIRMQAPVLETDAARHPQFQLFKNQSFASNMMSDARSFVTRVYEPRTVQEISDSDMEGIIREFGRPGVAEAVPRYFRDFVWEDEDARRAMFQKMTFPVLVLQGEEDPAQPLWYYEGIEDVFPDVKFQVIKDAGHFTELEKPQDVSKAILDFLSQ
ncbi:MAG: alpha/beta hydrolase [Chloroflexi bacterium]|nr:alpha/beta hydrolase [Chloroflexota bacterium]